MKQIPGSDLLHTLLLRGASGKRLWTSLAAISVGITLLLAAVLIWWNFDRILNGRASEDSLGSTFLTLSRNVTTENMGHPEQTVFSAEDIEELRHAPEVEDIGVVQPLRPRAYMQMEVTPGVGFSADMFLEAVPDRFMDNKPADWTWQAGKTSVPIILSASFLSLYNYVFAPSRGLPQLSESTIGALPFRLTIGSEPAQTEYIAHVVGFSDRITSVLVPESFIRYSNGAQETSVASRLIVKVADPSSTDFARYIESRGYGTNTEMLRWSKIRAIVQVVAIITGILAMLLLGISLLVFVLFIELTIARAAPSVDLLQQLGYSPAALRRYLLMRFLPLIGGAVMVAILVSIAAQAAAHYKGLSSRLTLPVFPGWPVWGCLLLVCLILMLQVRSAIGKALQKA